MVKYESRPPSSKMHNAMTDVQQWWMDEGQIEKKSYLNNNKNRKSENTNKRNDL